MSRCRSVPISSRAGETGKSRVTRIFGRCIITCRIMHEGLGGVTGAACRSVAGLEKETLAAGPCEANKTSMCIWAERHKTKLPKAIRTRKLQLSYQKTSRHFDGLKTFYKMHRPALHALAHGRDKPRLASSNPSNVWQVTLDSRWSLQINVSSHAGLCTKGHIL